MAAVCACLGIRSHWIQQTCLLALCLWCLDIQAETPPPPTAQEVARQQVFALLHRAQNVAGRREHDLPQAWAQIQQGLQQTHDDPIEHAQWMGPLWFYYLLQDNHRRASEVIEQSLRLLTESEADPDRLADVRISLAYSLTLLGKFAQAKDHLRRAIVSAAPQGNRTLLADLYFSLADAYRKTGEPLVAERYFSAALQLDQTSGDIGEAASSQLKLGSLARESRNYAEAERLHNRALSWFENDGNYRAIVAAIELARDYAAQGKLDQSRRLLESKVLRDSRTLPEQLLDAKILMLKIANDRSARGDTSAVNKKLATSLIREIHALLTASAARQQSDLTAPTQRLQFAEQAIRRHALERNTGAVIARGEATLDLIARVAAELRASNDDGLAWLAQAQPVLNQYVKALYELAPDRVLPLLESYYDQPPDTVAARHIGAIGRAFETEAIRRFDRYIAAEMALVDTAGARDEADPELRHHLQLRDLARDSYLAGHGQQPASRMPRRVEAIARQRLPTIPGGDAVLRYFVQDGVSFGILVTRDRTEFFGLPPHPTVQRLVQEALATVQVANVSFTRQRAALAAARQLLPLEILLERLSVRRLVVVTDDTVQPLPFAAIDISSDPHVYVPLVSRFEIVRTKSIARYYARQPRNTGRDKSISATYDVVVFADPKTKRSLKLASMQPDVAAGWAEQLVGLPSARREAKSIAAAFPDRRVKTYIGVDATSQTLLAREARTAKLLHIATHGYFNSATPGVVGFATAAVDDKQRGFLGLTELFADQFSSRLVVISGCETMRGRDYSGWGVRSLADGFITGGAGSVIGALWRVPDRTTSEMMNEFYRALRQTNGNSAAALREAQLKQFDSPQSQPFFWAAFALESANRRFDRHLF
ncbi:MAG TPA: CHAT domain-containing tetratricopeptide repeat protein [Steroidobacter sp.]|uniref:CHAT domain-containing protein n=1 Tax=Steroidobacter sp. TaxID=1978227 RepID=UPI002EDB8857